MFLQSAALTSWSWIRCYIHGFYRLYIKANHTLDGQDCVIIAPTFPHFWWTPVTAMTRTLSAIIVLPPLSPMSFCARSIVACIAETDIMISGNEFVSPLISSYAPGVACQILQQHQIQNEWCNDASRVIDVARTIGCKMNCTVHYFKEIRPGSRGMNENII